MARRKTSPAEDLVAIVAMLPWWAGALLAVVSYLFLNGVASQPVVATGQPGQLGAMISQNLWKTMASVGQYILPIICLAGAGISVWRRRTRQKLVMDVVENKATDALGAMSWREFEMLVGEGFRLQGYRVVENGGGGADGGVDLVLTRPGRNGGETFLVQCKQWHASKVGVDVVRELYGVMAARGAAGGFVVTCGRFTDEAVNFASGRNVNLVDGPKLYRLIREAKAGADRASARTEPGPAVQDSAKRMPAPSCPLCLKPMVRRTARTGVNAGREFWGGAVAIRPAGVRGR